MHITRSSHRSRAYCCLSTSLTKQAMAFDGVVLNGQSLKLRRPKDYAPLPGNIESGQSATQSSTRLHVAGLPSSLSEDQVPLSFSLSLFLSFSHSLSLALSYSRTHTHTHTLSQCSGSVLTGLNLSASLSCFCLYARLSI